MGIISEAVETYLEVRKDSNGNDGLHDATVRTGVFELRTIKDVLLERSRLNGDGNVNSCWENAVRRIRLVE